MNTDIKQPILQGNRSSDFIIRISSESGEGISGKIEHVVTGQVHYFKDFLELLVLIQYKLNEKDFPQSDSELRTFQNKG